MIAQAIKELYKRGCNSLEVAFVLEKRKVNFAQVLGRVFVDAYWVLKFDLWGRIEPTLSNLSHHYILRLRDQKLSAFQILIPSCL